MIPDRLSSAVLERREWAVDQLARAVAEPSVTGRNSRIADLFASELAQLGCHVQRVPCSPQELDEDLDYSPAEIVESGAPDTLVARFPVQEPGERLLLFAHVDTEAADSGWSSDPLVLRRDGGRLFGLGAADDLSGCINILATLRCLVDLAERPSRQPVIVLASGKQGGSLGMLPGVLAAGPVAAALYVHPQETGGGLRELKVRSRGVARFRFCVPGETPSPAEIRSPISADPHAGNNAAVRAARLASRLADSAPSDACWAVTGIEAGASPFEVPDVATVEVCVWFESGHVADQAAALQSWCRQESETRFERENQVVVSEVGLRAQPASCPAGPWLEEVAATVAEATGEQPALYGGHSASDIRFPLRRLACPTVGLGATAGGFYGPDEWVDELSWHRTTEVLLALTVGAGA